MDVFHVFMWPGGVVSTKVVWEGHRCLEAVRAIPDCTVVLKTGCIGSELILGRFDEFEPI